MWTLADTCGHKSGHMRTHADKKYSTYKGTLYLLIVGLSYYLSIIFEKKSIPRDTLGTHVTS
jgi:hypothetical protein